MATVTPVRPAGLFRPADAFGVSRQDRLARGERAEDDALLQACVAGEVDWREHTPAGASIIRTLRAADAAVAVRFLRLACACAAAGAAMWSLADLAGSTRTPTVAGVIAGAMFLLSFVASTRPLAATLLAVVASAVATGSFLPSRNLSELLLLTIIGGLLLRGLAAGVSYHTR